MMPESEEVRREWKIRHPGLAALGNTRVRASGWLARGVRYGRDNPERAVLYVYLVFMAVLLAQAVIGPALKGIVWMLRGRRVAVDYERFDGGVTE